MREERNHLGYLARLGDPAYLRAVVAAQTRLDEIDGIDAPKRLEHGGEGGAAMQVTIVEAVKPDAQAQ